MATRRIGIINIDMEMLEQVLDLPEDVHIERVHVDFVRMVLQIMVSHPDLPELEPLEVPPNLSAVTLFTEPLSDVARRFTWPRHCPPDSHGERPDRA